MKGFRLPGHSTLSVSSTATSFLTRFSLVGNLGLGSGLIHLSGPQYQPEGPLQAGVGFRGANVMQSDPERAFATGVPAACWPFARGIGARYGVSFFAAGIPGQFQEPPCPILTPKLNDRMKRVKTTYVLHYCAKTFCLIVISWSYR